MISALAAFKSPTFHFKTMVNVQTKAKMVREEEGDFIEVEVTEVVVMVEVEAKIKIGNVASPTLLLLVMVKLIMPKLLLLLEDSLSAFIVSNKGLKGVIIGPIGVNF